MIFKKWGIPTTISTIECSSCGIPLIASGGVRDGIQCAKLLRLGSDYLGFALPLLKPSLQSPDAVIEKIKKIEEELKIKRLYGRELKIDSLYVKGIDLLKKGAFKSAYRYFDKITEQDLNLKGAWLNKGVALGNLGKFDEEIVCYKIALRIDKNYEKALDNIKVAKKSLGVQ